MSIKPNLYCALQASKELAALDLRILNSASLYSINNKKLNNNNLQQLRYCVLIIEAEKQYIEI